MGKLCITCTHPNRERIEADLALESSCAVVAKRWGIERRSLLRHRTNHMTQADFVRLRGIETTHVEHKMEELIRLGGQEAVLGFSRLIDECRMAAEKCTRAGAYETATKYHKLQLELYKEKAKVAALYPGRKAVTNNNLVLGDVSHVFDMIDAVLKPYPEARQAVALAFAQQPELPALEHEA